MHIMSTMPEVILDPQQYTSAIDLWSIGAGLFAACNREP